MNAFTDYETRARELLLAPALARAFVALNRHADAHGVCPSCDATVGRYESDRYTHARTCTTLQADGVEVAVTRPTAGTARVTLTLKPIAPTPAPALWAQQFGRTRFAIPALITDDARLEDVSYGNDVCPSFVAAGPVIDGPTLWVDAVEPADRETEGAPRFTVTHRDFSIAFESETDAVGAVEALLAATAAERARTNGGAR